MSRGLAALSNAKMESMRADRFTLVIGSGSRVPRQTMIAKSSSLMILASSPRQSMSLGVAV